MYDLVSVIVTAYNNEDYIENAVKSVINQSYKNLEIIVIDDGSADNTLNICYNIQKEDDRVFIYHQENKGVSSARNLGLKKASGKYVCFLDADDYYFENYIINMIHEIEDKNAELAVCGYKKTSKVEIEYSLHVNYNTKEDACNELLDNTCLNAVWNKMFLRNKIVIPFDENLSMGEDLKFVCEYISGISRICLVEGTFYSYNANNNSSLTKNYITDSKQLLNEYDFIFSMYERNKFNINKVYRWFTTRLYWTLDACSLRKCRESWKKLVNMDGFENCINICKSRSIIIRYLLFSLKTSAILSYLNICMICIIYKKEKNEIL